MAETQKYKLHKYELQKCRNKNYRNTEKQITEVQKYKLQDCRNACKEELPKGPRYPKGT